MRVRRLAPAPLLLAAALVTGCAGDTPLPSEVATAPASAKMAGSGTHTRFTEPIYAVMPAGTCGLTTDVTITGEMTYNVQITQTGTGRFVGFVHLSAQGTASGDDGTRYRYSYNSNARIVDFIGFPAPDNPPYTAYITDRFQLSGQGRAPNVTTHWLFTIRLAADGTPTVLREVRRNQECDPI